MTLISDKPGHFEGNSILQRYKKLAKETGKYLHSSEHLLADDLSRDMLEPKKFAAYLGIAKTHYEPDLRALAKYILQKTDLPLEARGKYFFAALKSLPKKPTTKTKKNKKKRKNGKNRAHNTRTGKGTS